MEGSKIIINKLIYLMNDLCVAIIIIMMKRRIKIGLVFQIKKKYVRERERKKEVVKSLCGDFLLYVKIIRHENFSVYIFLGYFLNL